MKIQDLVQGTPEWKAFRLSHHGASEAAAMLGLSKKVTRTQLLRIKATGTPQEFSDWVQENILDYGHTVEANARPMIEEIIGDDLYPVTTSNDDEGGNLSASCDGLTMGCDVVFEHKQWNQVLAASVRDGILPDEHIPQCQQLLMITGAGRLIFVVSDGTSENREWLEVLPNSEWFQRIRAGWAQFDKDLAEYQLPAETVLDLVADPTEALPAVFVSVTGTLAVKDNFKLFGDALRHFLDEKVIKNPITDQDFADLDGQIKILKKAEDALDSAESQMLAQVIDVDAAKRMKDVLHQLARDNRLILEKLLANEKIRRKEEKVLNSRKAFSDYIIELQRGITGLVLNVATPDFAAAIKGLKTMVSMQDKLDTELANAKIAADTLAADFRTKLAWVDTEASEYRTLLPDLQLLSTKPLDDFKLAITARIDAHKKIESDRLEAAREAIRQQEADKLQREAQEQKDRDAEKAAAAALAASVVPAATPAQEQLAIVEVAPPAKVVPAEQVPITEQTPAIPTSSSVQTGQPIPPFHKGAPIFAGLEAATKHEAVPVAVNADTPPTLRLGQINERLAPISLTADGLAGLGFTHSATEKSAKLYHEHEFPLICAALIEKLVTAKNSFTNT